MAFSAEIACVRIGKNRTAASKAAAVPVMILFMLLTRLQFARDGRSYAFSFFPV